MNCTLTAIGIEFGLHGKTYRAAWELGGRAASEYAENFDSGITATTRLETDPATGITRRSDCLVNTSGAAAEIVDPKLLLTFEGEGLSVAAQRSTWSHEAQAVKLDLSSGEAIIGSKGRSCSGYVPHFVVSSADSDTVIELLPTGDWRARFSISPDGSMQVQIDRHEGVSLTLAPGQSLDLSMDSLIRLTAKRHEAESARALQLYAIDRLNRRSVHTLPVVFNTWFDRFFKISWESMETQLTTAAVVGCEVFMIDAGWYGPRAGDWSVVGDWRENPGVFSDRSLLDFAELVRAHGMELGIWMEPERTDVNAPARLDHPDWFVLSDIEGKYYPDLSVSEARDWVASEIARVVETYGVKWLKLDCNFDFSDDPHRTGHLDRMRAWYGIIDEIAERFPDLDIEGCASGGMRNDLNTVSHFHMHFLSDTVDPVDMVRIGISSLCRLSPGTTSKLATIFPTGGTWTPYGHDPLDTGDLVLCSASAGSEKMSSYHLDFAMRASMTGVLGISGSIAGLSADLKSQLAQHIGFYKKHREFIQSAVGIPLTPDEPLTNREGLAAVQLSDRDFQRNMIFVYNIALDEKRHTIKPIGLSPDMVYRFTDDLGKVLCDSVKGSQLMAGMEIECETDRSCVIMADKVQ